MVIISKKRKKSCITSSGIINTTTRLCGEVWLVKSYPDRDPNPRVHFMWHKKYLICHKNQRDPRPTCDYISQTSHPRPYTCYLVMIEPASEMDTWQDTKVDTPVPFPRSCF